MAYFQPTESGDYFSYLPSPNVVGYAALCVWRGLAKLKFGQSTLLSDEAQPKANFALSKIKQKYFLVLSKLQKSKL
jgi:hypothetical protein